MKNLSCLALAAWLAGCASAAAAIRINEIYYAPEDPSDGRQFIELRSTTDGAESLADLWLLEIDGDFGNVPGLMDNPGTILTAINLGAAPTPSTGTNGLFLWRDSATVLDPSPDLGINGPDAATSVHALDLFPGRVDLGYEGDESGGTKFLEDDTANFLLVQGFTGSVGLDLDTEANAQKGDGVFNLTPWTSVLDAVSMKEPGDPGFLYAGTVGGVDVITSFGADIFSWDPVENMWAFFDSGSGEDDGGYVGPFYANDGSGFYAATNDAAFADGRVIHVAADSEFLYASPGSENISGVGGLYRGDVDHDGDVDADDIDLLYDNLGKFGTRWDVALNFGAASLADVNALIHTVLGTEYGDADLNGVIDEADFLRWRQGFGTDAGWAFGDFDGDGLVTAAEYTTWRDHVTVPGAGAGAGSSSVPEPASLWLTVAALLFASFAAPRSAREPTR